MSAAELKALLDAAIAEAAKAPDDESLKSKVVAAQTAYDAKVALDAAAGANDFDPDKADEKTKAYIASLRKENAKYRTDAKDAKAKLKSVETAIGAVGDQTPEQKAAALTQENQTIAFENAVLANAVEHGVSKESMKYFKYLLADAANELKDGEELAPEKIAELAKEAKAKSVKTSATTTVVNQGGGAAPAGAGNNSDLTPEKFAVMSFNEKCKLYETNPTLYESMMKQASTKRLLK